jgi:hypothetical protein
MSDALQMRAEILKLSRLLGRKPEELGYLDQIPYADICLLREQVTDMLFTASGQAIGRLAAASKLLPVGLVATIGEHAFGPVLSARVAAMLEPSRAVEMAARLPAPFLADIAVEIDPRRTSGVIGQIPPRQIGEITRELVSRDEYVTMGRFVGHLHDESIRAAVAVMDDRTLLHVAFVLEEKQRLDDLISLLGPDRLDGVIVVAAEANLWPETLGLLSHLSDEPRRRVAKAAATFAFDDATLDSLLDAVVEYELWDPVLAIAQELPDPELDRIGRLLAERVQTLAATDRSPLVERARAAGVLARLGPLEQALRATP